MDVPIGERWQPFVMAAVETGRYVSASDVVTEGLRLVQQREEKLQALREMVEASITRGGSNTDEEVAAAVEAALDEMDAAEAER
jgi:antitoxin ParD1/3/4